MKKVFVVGVLALFLFAGCIGITPENPTGLDPNVVQPFIDAAEPVGQGVQAFGVAIGNPALAGIGILIAVIGVAKGAGLKKKENN